MKTMLHEPMMALWRSFIPDIISVGCFGAAVLTNSHDALLVTLGTPFLVFRWVGIFAQWNRKYPKPQGRTF